MNTRRIHPRISCTLAILLLSACGDTQMASFMIDGSQHSLTLVREQPYLGSSRWDLTLVTARQPICQRRHKLQPAEDNVFKTDLYRSHEGAFILHQDKHWYVTETGNCQLQQYQAPPPEPGDLLGAFEIKNGQFKFIPTPPTPAVVLPAAADAAPPVAPQQYQPAPPAAEQPAYPQPAESTAAEHQR